MLDIQHEKSNSFYSTFFKKTLTTAIAYTFLLGTGTAILTCSVSKSLDEELAAAKTELNKTEDLLARVNTDAHELALIKSNMPQLDSLMALNQQTVSK